MDRCDQDIFAKGHSICTLDACRHRAENFAQAVARTSGQRVDWHYSGGIANVLYLGDHAAVDAAVDACAAEVTGPLVLVPGECGSCDRKGSHHRPGAILRRFGPTAHGPYRAGDPLPPGVLAVDTH